jgi:hypothetical protein
MGMEQHNIGFILGLVAGEGCFTFDISQRSDMSVGLLISPSFQLKMKDEVLVKEVAELTHGDIVEPSDGTTAWRVRGWDNCRTFSNDLVSALSTQPTTNLFTESRKFESLEMWHSIVHSYEPPQNEKELRSLLENIQRVNDTELGNTVEEWMEKANV